VQAVELADSRDCAQKQAATMSRKTVMVATEVAVTSFDPQIKTSTIAMLFCYTR